MMLLENVPLSGYSTMRLGGSARYLCEVSDRAQVQEAVTWASQRGLPWIVIGIGSNIVWQDGVFEGLIIVNKMLGFSLQDIDEQNVYVTAGAGEDWDAVVARCVEQGLSGIEQLSLIPGTTGATPVQNVGAYGRELSDVLVTLEAFDKQSMQFVTLRASECGLGYRTSMFKTTQRGRYIISSITMRLTRSNPTPPFYASLQAYLDTHNITDYTPATIRGAVIAVRTSKLPDPQLVANNGSFFANPVVEQSVFDTLHTQFETMPYWETQDGSYKIPAAWLIEQTGFKDFHDQQTGMATWHLQPLVLVNESANSTADLLAFKQRIVTAVQDKFGVTLEQEPELLPRP